MRRRDLYSSIERHLERGNVLFEQNREAFERNREAFERTIATLDRVDSRLDEDHEFMRELILRVERSGREQIREIRALREEWTTEMRAQRGALLAILDRMGAGPAPPAPPA